MWVNDAAKGYAERTVDALGINIALGYVGYFVLGHYLFSTVFSGSVKKVFVSLAS